MFYLDPQDLVTDELVERLQTAVVPRINLKSAELHDVLTRIFSRMDDFTVFDRELDSAEKTAHGARLLSDGITKVLAKSGYAHSQFGFVLKPPSRGPVHLLVSSTALVPINFASAEQLGALPGIGEQLAELVIKERQSGGPFSSIQDLVDRVDGLGPKTGDDLAHALSFRFPEADFRTLPSERDLGQAIALLISVTSGEDVVSRLMSALDQIATCVAGDAPVAPPEIPRLARRDTDRDEFSVGAVETLEGSDYFTLVSELLNSAVASIDVCMFHIAFPSPNHPTRALLDALRSAHVRGITVRVLLDRDRLNDPYHSTVINSPARDFLNQDTELCRFDDESVLLHSKYVIIDNQVVVIGSHNWSAGSFFHFDDLSVVVHSSDYAKHMATRFTAQWDDVANNQ